jgi:4-amino-4-deoxy-L-arabinose transferase-like glycosyltransferase
VWRSPWLRRTALAGIVVLGVLLRVLGLRLGLPYAHHWDEVWIVDSVLHMLESHTHVPQTYQYGAPMMVLGAIAYRLLAHVWHDVPPDGASIRWIVRGVSVAISATGIVAIYLAARWGDWRSGRTALPALLAALLYATASQLVEHARYAVTDASLVALTAWTLALTARYLRARHLGWALAALVVAGVGVAFKISAAPCALVPVAAILLAPGSLPPLRSTLPHRLLLVAAVPIVAGTFVALNPMFVDRDHWSAAWGDVVARTIQTHDGGVPEYQQRDAGLPHLAAALALLAEVALHRSQVIAVALFATGVAGLAWRIARGNRFLAIAAAHSALAVVFMAVPNRAFFLRYYLAALPAVCLGFGFGAEALVAWVARARTSAVRLVAGGCAAATAALALVALPLRDALACQALSVDPRQRAVEWVVSHEAADARVAYTPSVVGKAAMGTYRDFADTLPVPVHPLPDVESCPELLASRADYVVTASYRDPANWVAYEELWFFEQCPPYVEVARFEPNPYEHDFAVTPSWDGRVTAIVLMRPGAPQR